MAAGKNGLKLRITGPDGSVREAVSDADSVIVGSGAQAAVKIQDPKVSNLHVMLRVDANGIVTAIDLGSESGTRVDGQQLIVPRTLASGDVLTVGNSRVEVLFGGPEPRDAPEPPAGAEVSKGSLQGLVMQRPLGAEAPRGARVPPGLRPRSAARPGSTPELTPRMPPFLQDPIPEEARPTANAKLLQVLMLWDDALLEVNHFRDGVPVTIGDGGRNAFQVFEPQVGTRHVLAMSHGDGLELRIPENLGVIITRQGHVLTKEALRSEGRLSTSGKELVYRLGLHERVEVAVGTMTFVLRYVRPSPAIRSGLLTDADFSYFKIVSICLLLAAALLAAMLLTPRAELQSAEDIFQDHQRVVKYVAAPERKIENKFQLKGVEEGAKAKDEEGRFGKEEAKKREADPSKPGSQTVDRNKREKDRKLVGKMGLLGALSGLKGGASNVFGPGGLGTGINNALGGLKAGAGLGNQEGLGGLGSRGRGTGGGGTALGLGGLGTQGSGRGAGGEGGIDLGGRGKTITKVVPGKTTVIGGLDKDVIAKIIRRHQNEIKYCYETELNKNPSLAGKVAVAFTIDQAGSVSDATVTETTLNNSQAENCMLARIRRWRFPEPKGGGVVTVTYPWLFSPAGAE